MIGDGIFVTSNERLEEDMMLNENMNYIDNIDGIKIYSFSTFDSLKEYTEVNNLEKYSKCSQNNQLILKNHKNTYLSKLRGSLSKRKITSVGSGGRSTRSTTNQLDFKIKLELTDDEEIKIKKSNCGKEHCNYGCICDTISNTDTIARDHCGRYECMFECICNNNRNSKKARKEIESNSESNDDKSLTRGGGGSARRSKRQKYLSLKAFEHLVENDPTKVAAPSTASVASVVNKRSRLEVFNETPSINNQNKKPKTNAVVAIKPIIQKEEEKPKIKEEKVETHEVVEKEKKKADYRVRLRNKVLKSDRFHHHQHLKKKLKLCVGIRNIRNKLQNRIKSSIKNQASTSSGGNSKHQFRPYVQSIILKIEMKSKTETTGSKLQEYRMKNILTIPLYVEVFAEWSPKSNEILLKIAKIIKKFSSNNISDWEQTEFDYSDLTIRLSSAKSNDRKTTPVYVKILKLNKDDKLNYVNKIKSKNEFNSVNFTSNKELFNNFLAYSTTHRGSSSVDEPELTDSSASNNKLEQTTIKSLPRLLCRKRSNIQKTKKANDQDKSMIGEEEAMAAETGKTKVDSDDFKAISSSLCKYRSPEYSSIYYDPFKDEKIILPLYREFNRNHVDEVSDVLNNIIKGVCLYDDHLKSVERKRVETEERKRNFLNFTKKILLDTKTINSSTTNPKPIPTHINSVFKNTLSSTPRVQLTQTTKSGLLPNLMNKDKIIQKISTNNSSSSSLQSTYSTISNKRITPILPKLPPCIKIISNSNNNKPENDKNLSSSSNNNNIIAKLFSSKTLNTYVPPNKPQNYLLNTKIFSTSSVNQKTQLITSTSNQQQQTMNNNKITNIELKSISNNNKDDSQQYKTFVKLVSLNNENTSNNNNNNNNNKGDSSSIKSHQNVQLIKVSSSKIVKTNENENILKSSVPTTTTTTTSLINSNLNIKSTGTDVINLNTTKKIFIKNPQNFNNLIMTPINSNSKTIYKILPKTNDTKQFEVNNNKIPITKVQSLVVSTTPDNRFISNAMNKVSEFIAAPIQVNKSSINENLENLHGLPLKEKEKAPSTVTESKIISTLSDNTIAIRKRKRKQDFSELLHKCVSNNQFFNKLTKNVK